MPFLVFLFFGFVIYMKPEVLYYPVIIIVVVAILLLIFKSTTKKQNQNHLIEEPEPVKKVTQNKDNSLYQSYQPSQKQRGQKPTNKNTSGQKIKKAKSRKANQKKGEDGEKAFQMFLEAIEIPFTFVDQKLKTKYSNFKRPDFILGYEYSSNKFPIAFEVKNHQTSTDKYGNKCHKLEIDELDGLENFSREMSMPVYFAFKDGDGWLFISLKQFDDDDFSFKYKSKFDTHLYHYIRLSRFEKGIKNRGDFDNFINKHKVKTTTTGKN